MIEPLESPSNYLNLPSTSGVAPFARPEQGKQGRLPMSSTDFTDSRRLFCWRDQAPACPIFPERVEARFQPLAQTKPSTDFTDSRRFLIRQKMVENDLLTGKVPVTPDPEEARGA